MNIPEFDMIVLLDIAGSESGRSRQELINKHGLEITVTIDFLLSNDLVKIHERSIKPFFHPAVTTPSRQKETLLPHQPERLRSNAGIQSKLLLSLNAGRSGYGGLSLALFLAYSPQ